MTTTWTIEISACDDEISFYDEHDAIVTYTYWVRVFDASGRLIAGRGFTTKREAEVHASGVFLGIGLAGHDAGVVDKTASASEPSDDEDDRGCGYHDSDREDFHADG